MPTLPIELCFYCSVNVLPTPQYFAVRLTNPQVDQLQLREYWSLRFDFGRSSRTANRCDDMPLPKSPITKKQTALNLMTNALKLSPLAILL